MDPVTDMSLANEADAPMDNAMFPPIYTSEDEHEPTASGGSQGTDYKSDAEPSVPSQPSVRIPLESLPKKSKQATASSLVSYAIDDDDEENNEDETVLVAMKMEVEELPPLDAAATGKASIEVLLPDDNADSVSSSNSPQAKSDSFFDTHPDLPAIFTSDHVQNLSHKSPIHVPSEGQLLNAQSPEVTTERSDPTPPVVTPVSRDRSQLQRILDEVKLPPEPPGHCPMKLQEKVDREVHRMRLEIDYDPNRSIQDNKAFRNPSIYEKLISFLNIDEKGTNFPPEIYNPYRWPPQSYYDELARIQNREIDRITKLQKEQKKADPDGSVTQTQPKNPTNTAAGSFKLSSNGQLDPMSGSSVATGYTEPKKRSKWDAGNLENSTKTTSEQVSTEDTKSFVASVGGLVK
ncbi:unnamed protein product [Dicrocoelium dendriticum]|nr:unnamed protein product [Dicrocoelium dendriticum]